MDRSTRDAVGVLPDVQQRDVGAGGRRPGASTTTRSCDGQSGDAAPWGTEPADGKLFEASAFQPAVQIGEQPVTIQPGARDLPSGETDEVVFTYGLAESGQKSATFGPDHIAVQVVHPGAFTEHLPLLMRSDDDLVIADGSVRLQREDQMFVIAFAPDAKVEIERTEVRHGPFRVVRLKLTAAESLDYRLAFQTDVSALH